ncbi:unnamed protein product [Bemisia tabaci]|uniref:Uncharacterized protein n=1 Tax=Bemisia tabaci TaxID=7038 RepID=A0A9P0G614_BEMTA|nr:unnamed protein product [Bemisia tabaci]
MGSANILILVGLFIIGPALCHHPPTESSQTHPSAPSPGKRNEKEHQAEISYEPVVKPQKRNWKRIQWTPEDCKMNCLIAEGYIVGDFEKKILPDLERRIIGIATGKLDAHKGCICEANEKLLDFLKERKLIISDFLDARKKSVTAGNAWLINHRLTPRYFHGISPYERRGEYDRALEECETKCREDDGYLFGYSRTKRLWVSVASVDVRKNCHCKVNRELLFLLMGMNYKLSDFLDARKESVGTVKTWLRKNRFNVLYP